MTEYHSVGDGNQQIGASGADMLGSVKYEGTKKYVYAYATTTCTKGYPFIVTAQQTAGQTPALVALTTNTATAQYMLVGVPSTGMVSGDTDWVQVGGACDITVAAAQFTAGYGFKVTDGVIVDGGAAYNRQATEFGPIASTQTTATNATTVSVFLPGVEKLSAT